MNLALAGIGTAVPPHALSQAEAVELHTSFCGIDEERSRTLRALYRRSRVSKRHMVVLEASEGPLAGRQSFYAPSLHECDRGPGTAARMRVYEAAAPPLAAEATHAALIRAEARPGDVTHLVTVSCTGFVAPGLEARVIERLGLAPSTRRTHLGFMGCHGALNGLRVAGSLVDAEPDAVVAVCCVELCSLHFAYGWDTDMLVPNALFADGAAAVVGRASEPSDEETWTVVATGTWIMPGTAEDMTWRIGDHGFRMTLSARVPDLIASRAGGWLAAWLGESGLALDDVASWAVHPGGPRILGAVEEAAGLTPERTATSRAVLSDHGNMSSATVLFIVDRLRAQGAPRPCVALAFGPGLVLEAALIV